MRLLLSIAAALLLASPAVAQMDMSMPGMKMPVPTAPLPTAPKPAQDMSTKPGMDMSKPNAPPATTQNIEQEIGNTPAPSPPTDNAADKVFGSDQMAGSRTALRREIGGMPAYTILFNLAEYRVQKGSNGYRWDGEGWFGGDLNRFVVKTEGEGLRDKGVESAELQALYSRAVTPYFNLQAGVRQDIQPHSARTYATVGFEGIAPYWFELSGSVFLSDKGNVLGRLEGYYDQRITQKLILQPRVELNFAARNVSASRVGAGLTNAEVGLRLRYEFKRELAPYVGLSWDAKASGTAEYARAAGDRVQRTSLVIGLRAWF